MDWQLIRNALIFLGISAVISASVVVGSLVFLHEAKDQYGVQERRLDDVRTRYRRLDEERVIVDAYFPHFQRFVQTGLIGEEHRLTWLEALQNAAERIGLPELRYDISSRKPHVPDFPVDDGFYQVYATDMQLTIGLLHAGDLLSLLAELDRHAVGIYRVVYCRLRRIERGFSRVSEHNPNRANLNAECTLRWYTLDERADNGS
uniref:Uncharacterized protein n=1 Tax=Candidatus Kentrum sp. TUN TaxID=2126343 RepID=A0A450ZL74_9GAMM|nr:MAG: hypothetical protein BECKTUN1418F_GA0071002_10445 [Candidatus Kentron sp. TUN]VFK56304.1 MAG: hypothetical protein BECKTUN1418D_GA0071000_10441 [Candidatus Kentron sp. TUN]VFK57364.1 MAG: hypothetical protein BECKTUN1418E_GA0071001_10455 [Candidatus Kentron sp. TUN]